MCGIAGTFGYLPELSARAAALRALKHRGPDASGCVASDSFWIAHTLLAIADDPGSSVQPMGSPCRKVSLAFNGEIFNAASLRRGCESRGFQFRTKSDTEVLLATYLCLGNSFVEHLEGMFAFAILDRRGDSPTLLLSRDASGIKPLYIERNSDQQWAFASELSAIRAISKKSDAVSRTSLALLLSGGSIPQPRTIYASTIALKPGTTLRLTLLGSGRVACDEHHSIRPFFVTKDGSSVSDLADAIENDVVSQMEGLSDVHLFMGGGIDSAVLAAVAARNGMRVHSHTLSLGEAYAALDETRAAHALTEQLGWKHYAHRIREESLTSDVIRFASLLDQPTIDGFNSYLVSSSLTDISRVAFSGTGPDELLFGYSWMNDILRPNRHKHLDDVALAQEWISRCTLFSYAEIARLIGVSETHVASARLESTSSADLGPEFSLEGRIRNICLHRFTLDRLLRDLDVTAMANKVEVRVPLLGNRVAKACWGIRSDQLHGDSSFAYEGVKKPMALIAKNFLPEAFLSKNKKRSFMLPFEAWMRGPLRSAFEELFFSASSAEIDGRVAVTYWNRFLAGEPVALKAWLLGITLLWERERHHG